MSKLEIEIPDDRWFRGEWDFRPQDKQLCVVIPKEYITESRIRNSFSEESTEKLIF